MGEGPGPPRHFKRGGDSHLHKKLTQPLTHFFQIRIAIFKLKKET